MQKNIEKRWDFSVAIIAGGKSNRFGEPKAIAPLGNRRLIDYTLSIAKQLSSDIMLIYGTKAWISSVEFQVIHDLIPDCGPIGGIYTALSFCKSEWIVIIPCDMPLLTKEIYTTLLNRRQSNRPVVAKSHSGLEPLVSVWPKMSMCYLKTAIQRGDYSLYTTLCRLDAKEIYLPESQREYRKDWFLNINYKTDLEKVCIR